MSLQFSIDTFAEYAAMNPPDLPSDPMSAMQVRLARWEAKQGWPITDPLTYACGVTEEIGEFIIAMNRQGQIGQYEQALDGIGDAMIFLTQWFTLLRMDFGVMLNDPVSTAFIHNRTMSPVCGELCHIALKSKAKIRGYENREKVRFELYDSSRYLMANIRALQHRSINNHRAIYLETASKVIQRDWIARPITG